MKIAQIIPCLGQKSGGPSRSVYELTKGLRSIGVESEIMTNNYLRNPNIASDSWIYSVDIKNELPFEFNTKFCSLLKSKNYDLYHIHSIYSYPVSYAARYARKKDIPYIIAPRGSLYETAINSSSTLKKKVFNRLFLCDDLNNASVIHATCQEEMKQIRNLGVKTPIAIIPNSISLPEKFPCISMPSSFRLCFLGRINPIKNIDGLLRAWERSGLSKMNNAELVVIGDAKLEKEKIYLHELHQLEKQLCIYNVTWKGNLQGTEKDNELNSCSFLILPSFSENFGMVVVEALIQGVPVIATRGTPWNILESERCGWWIENNVDKMAEMIERAYELSLDERLSMAQKGQNLVKQHFSTPAISQSLMELYSWILEEANKPDFVYM